MINMSSKQNRKEKLMKLYNLADLYLTKTINVHKQSLIDQVSRSQNNQIYLFILIKTETKLGLYHKKKTKTKFYFKIW